MSERLSDIQPYELHKNLFFVGSSRVSVHIFKTEKGLVMLDTGYPDMLDQILDSMKELSLDPKDLCAIFHSHGHIDHYGCTRELKEISGAKTYISRIDNDIVNGTLDLSWAKELNYERIKPFDCDVLIEDGDVFDFGNVVIRCRNTPGHTAGVMSYFVTLRDGNEEIVAAMHGGIGINTMRKAWLDTYGFPYTCREVFLEGLSALSSERVDLVMGNHPENNNTKGKIERLKNGEDILDREEWVKLLTNCERTVKKLIADGL